MLDQGMQEEFIRIIREELVPAMGCTEPIALAYASARGREALGCEPERIVARCSGNMIKNVRCVTIPNSGGLTGIEAACILGATAGDASAGMEVLEKVSDAQRAHAAEQLAKGCCHVEYLESEIPLHFIVELFSQRHTATVEVRHTHTNVVLITRDGEVIFEKDRELADKGYSTDRSGLSLENIKTFADEVELALVRDIYERQIRCNMDIAYEGISGDYGIGIGRVIRESYADGIVTRMKAYAAAASEARMGGCDMPVIINSGSGNQGIASSVPVIVYAREKNIPTEKLYRSLVFSSLLTIYQKEFIGKLSAFCGAVSASCASAAAITYMTGGTLSQIKATIDNTLANIPGVICDGAKISCAAKIASSLDASMMAHYLAMQNKEYEAYTGILKEDAGETISCVGYIGKVGMQQTDKEIIKLMLE
ncbi:MAG: L-serine ammonia-lyase, iron-sulfur-dependent, subunit alpha [bacterium]|nr:L-serine ammonia-lyase, iron-sulfur-dependent, subunit alpha [bacterium]MCM1376462.1 L-serine ammonia-lyase, iron-sulfur-dependent, subunit alpha [Muribaculum sp.]